MICGSGGSKSRPLLEVEMSKKCTLLWPEAHFEVKMYKTHQVRSTFGSWDVEKVHAVVVRSKFPSQNVQNTSALEKKCTPLWREALFQVKMLKTRHAWTTFEGLDVVPRGRRKGLCTLSKVSKKRGFCSIPKTMADVGHLKRICKDAFSVAGAVQETCSSEMLGGQGAAWGVAFWSIRSSGLLKMILRDRCSTSYDLASLFRGRSSTLDRWSGKIAKHIGTRPSALHSTFHFWRTSRRIVSFLMLSTSKNEEVSQIVCFFWCCQVQKVRKSRRLVSFFTLSSSKIEKVSQNSCVFKPAGRQMDRWTATTATTITSTTTLYYTTTTTSTNILRYITQH